MKPLLVLKWIDLAIQLLALIVTPVIMVHDGGLLAGWVALGAAQTLSCGVNLFGLKKQFRAKSRLAYEIIIALFVACCIPIFACRFNYEFEAFMGPVKGILCVIVFASPGLAIWYFTITIAEMFKTDMI